MIYTYNDFNYRKEFREKTVILSESDIKRIEFLKREAEMHFENMKEAKLYSEKKSGGYSSFRNSIQVNVKMIEKIRNSALNKKRK
jgi:hypothetical protein